MVPRYSASNISSTAGKTWYPGIYVTRKSREEIGTRGKFAGRKKKEKRKKRKGGKERKGKEKRKRKG